MLLGEPSDFVLKQARQKKKKIIFMWVGTNSALVNKRIHFAASAS